MEERDTWATEILHEIKEASRRVYYLALALLIGWLLTIAGFLWYITLPVEVSDISQQSDNQSYNQIVGGDYNGSDTDSTLRTESSQN